MLEGHRNSYWAAREAYKKALSSLNDQVSKNPDARIFLQLGQLHLSFEEYDDAEASLRKLWKLIAS